MKFFKQQFHSDTSRKGFVILFAILISSVMLLISVGIFQISQKEAILSSFSRESQKALYAADSGIECTLYQDVNPPVPSGGGAPKTAFPIDGTGADTTVKCSENTLDVLYLDGESSDDFDYLYVLTYQSNVSTDVGCSFILVEKSYVDPMDTTLGINTRVTAVGFNSCLSDGTPNYADPSILERRLSATYTVL